MALLQKRFRLAEDVVFKCYVYLERSDNGVETFWFKAKEVATFLGYAYPSDAVRVNVLSEWKREWKDFKGQDGNRPLEIPANFQPGTVFISEPGLYALVSRSKKPHAVRFTKWVYEEVLPSIRRTGVYVNPDTTEMVETLRKKEAQLEEINNTNRQLVASIQGMSESNNYLSKSNNYLCDKLAEQKPRLAVMPQSEDHQHVLRVYKRPRLDEDSSDEDNPSSNYKFVRVQKRNLSKSASRVGSEYDLVSEYGSVPNAMNVLNGVKERLKIRGADYNARFNEITTREDVVSEVSDLLADGAV